MKRVVVVGGGIAGLTTALHLKDGAGDVPDGLDVVVVEAADRAGGNIQTDRVEGFTIEKGPNGFLDNVPTTPSLVRRLGLESQLVRANEAAAKRFLFRGGRLHLLPSGPVGFLKSSVLSVRGRIRVFGEPFARGKEEGVDESIFDFARRRIGEEAASVLIDAMVSGVFAGDVRELSLASSFPKMAAMEEEYGGLVRAMVARMRERRAARREVALLQNQGEGVEELTRPGGPAGPGGTLTSFREGLDTLPDALARELGGGVQCGFQVAAIERPPSEDPSASKWLVRSTSGEVLRADALVMALPAPGARRVLGALDGTLADLVGKMPSAGLAVVALGYESRAVGGAPDGFGFLVPRGSGMRSLGCLWDSSIFPNRAPEEKVLLRVMIGGAHDPEAVDEGEESLLRQVREDLDRAMGINAEPLFSRVYRWPSGIGQYTVGHGGRMDAVARRLQDLPGLWLAGSSFYGISMNACIEKAGEQSREVLGSLKGR
jgi:oxygen-dependent protoporphyrinogen oxidase